MSTDATVRPVRRARSVPIHRALPELAREPAAALAGFAREAGGKVVRLELGPFRPYLVTHPDDVQQVMRLEWTNYRRVGTFWRPLERIFGQSIMSDGAHWHNSREILQPLFTARYIATIADEVAASVAGRIEEWDEHVRTERDVNAAEEMAGILSYIVNRVLFGDKLSREDGERIIPAFDRVSHSLVYRFLMPFMPYSIRVPRDKAFLRAVEQIDDVVFPVVRRAMAASGGQGEGTDVISVLCRSTDENGEALTDVQIRDALVSVYAASSETTAMVLTWLWPLLERHPRVAARLQEEIDEVVGAGPARPEHIPRLRYTRMVLMETLRLYPAGWLLPRQVMEDAEIGGVRVRSGSTVLICPYATQRLEEFWERPDEFDPERFAPENGERPHRYAYFPFGGGPHKCLGEHLFHVEVPLVVASILSRFRVSVRTPGPFTTAWAASLRPRQKVELGIGLAGHDRAGIGR
ncbi:cytochrome P450 [Streptosporangium sp. CA-135522]|uniref:cytochrome P450 n=1 Tax=Streptosporangium sp. CA-135522 TaxID=3240072 RepID=UPI003D8DA0B3